MIELLAILAPVALVDSLSVLPIASVPLIVLLSGRRPAAGSLAFIAGIILTYFPFGLLLLFGLDALFDSLAGHFAAWWNQEPDLGEVVLQIIIGLIVIFRGQRLCTNRGNKKAQESRTAISPAQAFGLAVMINLAGMWGALPYFAAIAQILKADFSTGGMLAALLFYNLVFALPLAGFLILRLLLGERSERWFQQINDFLSRWAGRLLLIALIGLGIILIIDGISWLSGMPWLGAIGR